MERIENQTFDMERALYGSHEISVKNCSFDGPADGESALKESSDINVEHCFCNLRYPFWHDHRLKITDSEMTPLCRAALWYSDHIEITGTKLHGIKALRECSDIIMKDCHIVSPEFGWSVKDLKMECGKRIFHDAVSKSSVLQAENDRKVFFPIYRRCCI